MLVDLHETEDCLQVAWDSLTLIVFVGTARAQDVRTIWHNDRQIIARHGSLTSITVMAGELRMTAPDEVKKLAAEMTSDLAPDSVGGAVVVPWEGIAGATFRTVLASIYLLGRIRTPNKVFKALPEAIDWVLALPNQRPALAAAGSRVQAELALRVAAFESRAVTVTT